MQIRDSKIRSAYTQAIQDGNISQQDAQQLLDAARDGNRLSKNERKDLEGIVTQLGPKLDGDAKQAIVNFLNACSRHDKSDMEPAPTPQIVNARAFDRAAEGATFRPNRTTTIRPAGRDPVYLELRNVELGSTLQLINLSKDPSANFERKNDVTELTQTGRNVERREGAVYLNADQMKKFGIEPGDVFQLRQVDHSGNPSMPVTGEFEPDDWANGMVTERVDNRNVATRGGQLNALDGEAARKNLIIKAVNDTRPPQILEDKLSLVEDCRFDENDSAVANVLYGQYGNIAKAAGKDNNANLNLDDLVKASKDETLSETTRNALKELTSDKERFAAFEQVNNSAEDGIISRNDLALVRNFKRSVSLSGFGAMEPRATVTVLNTRSGETFTATIPDDRTLNLNLGNVQEGDPLVVTPRDNENVAGKAIELVFSSRAEGGKAPKLKGGLGARLPGVI